MTKPKSRTFEVWLDSGASDGCFDTTVSLDDFGLTSEQWDALTYDQKENLMRDVAFESSDWGFREKAA